MTKSVKTSAGAKAAEQLRSISMSLLKLNTSSSNTLGHNKDGDDYDDNDDNDDNAGNSSYERC